MIRYADNLSQLGTETAFDVLARAAKLTEQGHDVINLGIGQPDFSTPKHIVEAAIKALRDGQHGYTPANGILALREAVSANLRKRHQETVHPDHILIVPGGKVTMFLAILMLGQAGNEILFPDPGFPIYGSMVAYSGSKPVPYPLLESQNFSFDADDILSRMTENTSLVIINSPANPTGGVVSKTEIQKLVTGLEKFPQAILLSDEIYSEMLYDQKAHVSLLQFPEIRDRLILLDGWSKTYAMTGWRIGFGVWPKDLIEKAMRLCINSHSCVNAPTQFAAIAALKEESAAITEMMQAFEGRRQLIYNGLNRLEGITCQKPAGAFYAFPNISGLKIKSQELQERWLYDAHIATIAGTSFGENGEGYMRFSFANSNGNIIKALDRLELWLEEFCAHD